MKTRDALEFFVVSPATGRVNETARDARDEELVIDLELHDIVQFLVAALEHRIELLRLGNRAREPVKHEARRKRVRTRTTAKT